MRIRHRLAAACTLLVGAALSPAVAAPPAEQVHAEVHAASRIAASLFARTPESGDVTDEAAIASSVGAMGLGEVMGWGQDRFDNVSPEVVGVIQTQFQKALRTLEAFPADRKDIGYDLVRELTEKLEASFDAIQQAVATPDSPDQRRRQLGQFGAFLRHHAQNFYDPVMAPSRSLAAEMAVRTLALGAEGIAADVAEFPDLGNELAEAIAGLQQMADEPPACLGEPEPSDACFAETSTTAAAYFGLVVTATGETGPGATD